MTVDVRSPAVLPNILEYYNLNLLSYVEVMFTPPYDNSTSLQHCVLVINRCKLITPLSQCFDITQWVTFLIFLQGVHFYCNVYETILL